MLKRLKKGLIIGCVAVSIVATAVQSFLPNKYTIDVYAAQTGVISSGVSEVFFRSEPGGSPLTHNGNNILLNEGQKLSILDTSNTAWYKVKLTYDGKEYTGYIASQFITSDSSDNTSNGDNNNNKTKILYGDVNNDGKINALDVLKIQKHIIGVSLLTGDSVLAADANRDDKISALDVLKVQKYIVGAGKIEANNNSDDGEDDDTDTGENENDDPDTGENENDNSTSENDFEAYLTKQGFPDSYKPYLRDLHNQYPKWKFIAVNTGLDWSYVVDNQVNKQGSVKNAVETSSSSPNYNWRSTNVFYDWAKDIWYPCDGTRWFAASDEFTTYYLDPRVYFYESYIFGFESLSYQKNIHNVNGVEDILEGTFMYNTVPKGETKKYSEIIMEAAKATNVSPYYLASKIKNELGNTISICSDGSYNGCYNFYNIGASDTPNGNPAILGLDWAKNGTSYGRPWTTASKSIIGGAQYIGEQYINKKQNTIYTQKFNVTNTSSLFWHQYQTNVQAVASGGYSVYSAYSSLGILDSAFVFELPVYNNMPEETTSKPDNSGNPNNWIKSLSIDGYSLTPTFTGKTTEYSLIVPEKIASVNINATTVNAQASISGTGKVSLNKGKNTIKLTVTAQNGNKRVYTISIVRGSVK